ncbi:DUF2868 domain-containing protein [Rhodoferax ferrireducens]|uniref:DUF2868 domain-containing protein n=1 Tax=Rhodoferax ferrireducens TaxID=192843 RepID=UPI000E0DF52D|nr:DUF2868 domain-containing protein [Rhodoferax ferrireducens]
MRLTEQQAQQITLVRVLEQTQSNDAVWSADDAKAATRATIELVGPKASFAEFVARRAQWALETFNKRTPDRAIQLRQPRWPFVAGQVLAVLALVCGFMTDLMATNIMHPGQINVVELPLVLLIVWNLAFMAWFFINWVLHLFVRDKQPIGPVIELFGKFRASESLWFGRKRQRPWLDTFKHDWSHLCGPINVARLKVAANLASMLFTLGALAHLIYGFASKHYRVGWETSLTSSIDASLIHTVISWVLAPGSFLLTRPIPDAKHIESLRMPPSPGEVAENWVWLYFGSVLAWVVIPRFYLVALNAFARWRMRRNFALPLTATYFTTLRAAWRGQRIGVSVVPFRYELSPALRANLGAMLKRIYGLAVDITIDQPVLMGDDATDWKNPVKREGHVAVLVIFNLTATAEGDTHGALLQALQKAIEHGTPIVPIVDTGAYRQDDPERLRQRCIQWRQTLDRIRFKPLFLDLHKAANDDLKILNDRLNHDD